MSTLSFRCCLFWCFLSCSRSSNSCSHMLHTYTMSVVTGGFFFSTGVELELIDSRIAVLRKLLLKLLL
uniref:Putative secreted protein n=1 Tax=Anopheles darlingi TaxID=43151 RepID=A0A2M4DLA6_ANODA